MKRREENWNVISLMFKFSAAVRKVMYTTKAGKPKPGYPAR